MKDLPRHDANGNVITAGRPHRPRSTMDLASAGSENRVSSRQLLALVLLMPLLELMVSLSEVSVPAQVDNKYP